MPTKNVIKVLLLNTFLIILMIYGVSCTPEPPEEGERLSGPAIVGTVTLNGTNIYFEGKCEGKGLSFSHDFYIPSDVLAILTADDLKDYRIRGGTTLAGSCYSVSGAIIVNTVTRFDNRGDMVTADVVILAVTAIR